MELLQENTMMQWIRERETTPQHVGHDDHFRTCEDFLALHAAIGECAPNPIDSLADYLIAHTPLPEIDTLREMAQQADPALDPEMVLTAACAAALGKLPEPATWYNIRKVPYHSWQIEHWLHPAMSAQAQRHADDRAAYAKLACTLFNMLENNELASESERRNTQRANSWAFWKSSTRQLEDLWWGLRGADFVNYEEEMRFFSLLHEIDPEKFQGLLAQSRNPFLVDAALQAADVTGYASCFARWEKAVSAAPLAFEPDGRWTGAVLLPLLLVHAKAELLAPSPSIPRVGADDAQAAALSAEVSEQANAVVEVLSARSDAVLMFVRWGNWLMRALLIHGEDEFDDIRSASFVDDTLLKAIGKALVGQALPAGLPSDAGAWEDWCYRCVQASWAHNGFIALPSFDAFAAQWRITPDTWHGHEGRILWEYATPHLSSRNTAPDLLAHLLAVPLASTDDYALRWRRLWESAGYLREVVEFGSDDAKSERYADQTDASRLLLQLACLGLACFDQVAGRLLAAPASPDEIVQLHGALSSAAMEMLHIDDTINRDQWKACLHHLALRRVFWDQKFRSDLHFVMFVDQQSPTIQDFLDYLQAEPTDLLTFLQACIQNQLDVSALSDELRRAAIDLDSVIEALQRLHTFRAHRYPMSHAALKAVEPLLQDGRRRKAMTD
jgi:hypothetical protein